jgi:T5SS/PEP-CTERM-associated repeat protein
MMGNTSSLTTGSMVIGRQGDGEFNAYAGTHLNGTFINIGREGGDGKMFFHGPGASTPTVMATLPGDPGFGGFVTVGRQNGSSGLLDLNHGAIMNIDSSLGGFEPGFQTAREIGASGEIRVRDGSELNVNGLQPFVSIGRRDQGELNIDDGTVSITGTSGNGFTVSVGRQGNGDGLLSIQNDGLFKAEATNGGNHALIFGRDPGTSGRLEMDGSALDLKGNSASMFFGVDGTGSGYVKNSTISITATGPPGPGTSQAALSFGINRGHGELELDNSEVELTGDATSIDLFHGRLRVLNGSELKLMRNPGAAIGSAAVIGRGPAGDGELEVSGNGSRLDSNGLILVGQPGSGGGTAKLTVADGGVVKASSVQVFEDGVIQGDGTIVADDFDVLNLGGVIAPGQSIGELSIDGAMTFLDEQCADPMCNSMIPVDTVLEIEIGGPLLGDFDQLTVSEGVVINGAVFRFSFINNFLPSTGDIFEFLTAGFLAPLNLSRVSLEFDGIAPGFLASLVVDDGQNGSISLLALNDAMAAAVPEPPSAAMLSLALILIFVLSGPGWRRGRRFDRT